VHHSQSPRIQNAAFRAARINAVYVALEVPEPRLEQALQGLHAARVSGLNLTTPHKGAAYSLVHERTRDAEEARAVNTLRWEADGWRGHATDGIGFLAWVAGAGIEVAGRRVLVLGAGGAASTIVPKLFSLRPATVQVVSRSAEHAFEVARRAARPGATPIASAGLERDPANDAQPGWDLLIRALAVESISPEEDLWWRGHAPKASVLDLNYGARSAAARARARAAELRYEDGRALLIHQGAASFEFWTGRKPSLEAMSKALRTAG
jgi:shikimate dehydrogenase